MRLRHAVLSLMLMCAAAPLDAQSVRLRGYGEPDLDALIRAQLSSGARLILRDTVIASGDTLRGDVMVVRARFILEGTVFGDLTGVDANMYLRPNARVRGRVTNIAGGYYPSELAEVRSVDDQPLAPYQVERTEDGYVIRGTVSRPALKLLGGARLPEYNRVDGLRAEWGPSILLPPFIGVEPIISGSIGYATEREDAFGRAELKLRRARSTLAFGWEDDITLTNEDWIRSQFKNSVSVIWNGKDYRNYYGADRTYLEFRRVLEKGTRTTQYWIRAQNELTRPRVAGDPFIVFDPDSIRSNPAVPVQRVTSAFVGAQTEWQGLTSLWNVAASVEAAAKILDSDRAYNAFTAEMLYAMKAIANHTLEIEGWFRGPLPGTESLPQQRWTFVGGSGTLYTFDIGEFRGDRLAFVETEYTIPFAERFTMPVLGSPKLKLMYNTGMAWSQDVDRSFEHNLGVRIQFALAYVRYIIDPRSGEGKFSANVTLPGKNYPWEKATRQPLR